MRTENWKKSGEFIFGTSNVNELIRKQIAYNEEDYRKLILEQNKINESNNTTIFDFGREEEYTPSDN